jgi:hypothetical protein
MVAIYPSCEDKIAAFPPKKHLAGEIGIPAVRPAPPGARADRSIDDAYGFQGQVALVLM